MSDIISLSVEINKAESMADRSLKLQLYTQELTNDEMAKVFSYLKKQCWIAIGENPIANMPSELWEALQKKPTKWDKSPSKRLRNVLFLLHEKSNDNMAFEAFYEKKMEEIIDHFKNKL